MNINLNCDLGEKSIHTRGENDVELLKIINSANIACGYHAGDKFTINFTIKEAIKNNVSIGAHPGFKDLKNFGRKRLNLTQKELTILIREQLAIINKIALKNKYPLTHVKPHGALNNMACENFEIAFIIGETIKSFNKELIYVILPLTQMEKAANKLNIKYANEIFADRNYEDSGQLISRSNKNSMIFDASIASRNIIEMLETSSIKCLSGKKIKCNIDTICIHSDSYNALKITKKIKNAVLKNGFKLTKLNELKKFN